MLLTDFHITQVLNCIADPTKIRVIASFSDEIDAVFPYLNATLNNVTYSHESKTVVMKEVHRLITLYPKMATIAKADDEADARRVLGELKDLMNETWERRDEIKPTYERRQLVSPVDVYRLLPKTNCKKCGEMTCFAFGCALLTGKRAIDECPVLMEPCHIEAADRLEEVLG
ncbi:MAG: (Fe-S)-binding protein [Dehalococcoidia bacterium]